MATTIAPPQTAIRPAVFSASASKNGRLLGRTQGTVLETANLTKTFGDLTVVDDLSFDVRAGEVLGFLGPNGSGKSTTVGMILGLLTPTKGRVTIAGQDAAVHPELVSEHIGAIIENPAFYPFLTGRDNLRALAMIHGKVDEGRIEHLLKLVNMHTRADRPYKTFSLGMKQRLGIAATLLTNPTIVILDEPTNGLDPAGQREVRDIIPRLAQEGHAVMLASHMLHEVEQVSDRVTIIRRGVMIGSGTMDELLRNNSIEVTIEMRDVAEAMRALGQLPFVERVDAAKNTLRVRAPADAGSAINRALVDRAIYAGEIVVKRVSLESLFLDLTESDEPSPDA